MVIMMKRPWDSEVGGVTLQRRIEKAVMLKSPKHKLSQMRDASRGGMNLAFVRGPGANCQ